ncbi:glycoside-pentoside-hexuronide (GPH):cation symporter [Microbacterium marmarense]|uniref:Glycoside-pentoside-hexuronide (GPH):cation symporter n=1 Tax=Microbacterium marmarense TaxID=3122051 RepID=A0ABU8LSA2_9MICO
MSQAVATKKTQLRPFGWRDKVGYLFGDFGNDFVFIFASSFLMVFYTNVAGLNPAHVGLIFLGARLLDAFTDVGWGRFLDVHKPSAAGRFRVWVARMALPLAAMSILLYVPMIGDWAYAAKLTYAAVSYLLWGSVFYTMVNISYGSMASVMSADPGDRSSLSVFRTTGAALAGLFVGVVPPLFIYATVDGVSQVVPSALLVTAAVFAVLSLGCYALFYLLTTERVVAPRTAAPVPFRTVLKALGQNRALLALLVANLLMMVGQFLTQTMSPYLWLNWFNNGQLSSLGALVMIVPMFAIAPFASRLGRRFGKKEIAVVAASVAAVLQVVIWLLRIENPWVYLALALVSTLGLVLFMMLVWAFITDVIDDVDVRTKSREDGTIYSINTWARKLGLAIVGGASGLALALVGFQAGEPTQAPETNYGIYTVTTLGPGILFGLFAVVMHFWYPLDRTRVASNVAVLHTRAAEHSDDTASD